MPGPKKAITVEPLSFKGWPRDRAKRRMRFIGKYLVTPRGHGVGKKFKLRAFQKELVTGAYAPGIRTALVSMARGNGKTALAAALAVSELFVGQQSGEVLVVASDMRQAGITFNLARRMIELNPELSERVHVYQDKLYVPETDSTLRPLPADYDALQGWDASLIIVDELHVVTDAVWEAVTSAAGKRPESLTLAISTPGVDKDTLMWRLVEHGRHGNDPAFYLKEYSAPEGCAVDDHDAWREANPALADPDPFLSIDGIEAVRRTIREPRFRQLRLAQWVGQIDTWLPFGTWEPLADSARVVGASERIVLGFDGSASGDSTALVGATVEENPHIFVAGVWERPDNAVDWRVPRAEVMERIREMFAFYDVVEIAADPWGWRSELETLSKEFGPRRVLEFNTGFRKRMGPATDRLYQAVMEDRLTHDGNSRLAVHVGNAVATVTPQGTVITKDKRNSKRKIDLAVAAIVATDRSAFHNRRRARVVSF